MYKFALGALVVLCLWALLLSRSAPKRNVMTNYGITAGPDPNQEAPRTPAEPTRWTVSEDGIGPVQIGKQPAEIAAAAGEYFGRPRHRQYTCSFAEWISAPDGVEAEMGDRGVVRVFVHSGGVRTNRGIGIGDDERRVLDAYDEHRESPEYVLSGKEAQPPYVLLATSTHPSDARRGIQFRIDATGHVVYYQAGYVNSFDRSDTCP